MEHKKHEAVRSSNSSFTETLFGPKDGQSSSHGYFGSVFGPSSTGLGHTGSPNKENFGNPKQSRTDYETQRNTDTAEPSYYSSSIYYGGQDVYPPTSNNNRSQHAFQRSRREEDPSGSSASRGNWWQGSLYY